MTIEPLNAYNSRKYICGKFVINDLKKIFKIKDVAEIADVSIATVSRVLNNFPSVKERNRRKVLQAVKELRYRPNISARRLAGVRNYTLGLILPYFKEMFSSYYVLQVIKGVEEEANVQGWDVLININRTNENEEAFYSRILNKTYIEGIIYAGNKSFIPRLKNGNIPWVVINMDCNNKLSCINIDNKEGAFKVVEHLIRLGHRKIAAITGSPYVQSSQDRLEGYCRVLKAHRLFSKNPDYFITDGNFEKMTAYKETFKLLSGKVRPTAIFAASDEMAVGAIQAIKEHGLKVPQDIAVVGFDNNPIAEHVEPKLTTVHQPLCEMAGLAVKVLVKLANGEEKSPVKTLLKTNLVIRESCGGVHLN